ncbi:uncharacterized protein LOC141614188 [Silene latifolia]|uniref:uncharacterized protein LOC141614188 n=1 Tax=Silene latifolia TaxID=37657 RepID=UPI003D7755F7
MRLYNRKVASPRCLVKIVLKKAYDSVEWGFLEQMLQAHRFPRRFIDMVMTRVSTPSYSLSVNGGSFGFFKGNKSSIMWILRGFATFSAASGLQLNKSKSEIYFNGASSSTVANILQVYGFRRGTLPFKYLGIPISSNKLTKNEGMKLVDKIVARIRGWGTRHLSYAGRLTLVSSVLSTLHSYWATIFLIPNGIMNKISATCRNFLWSGKAEYRKAPAISWDYCCLPKAKGGLGLRKLNPGMELC